MIRESFFQAFLYRLLTTFFYQIIAYFPFRRNLRFGAGWILLSCGITQITLSAIYAYATMHGAPVTAASLVSVLIGFLVFLNNVRADRRKILFLYIYVLDYVLLVQGLAYYTESLLFYSPSMTFGDVHTLILILSYTAFTAPLALYFLEKTGLWALETSASSFWNAAWLLPAFTTIIVAMYTHDGTVSRIRDIRFLVGRVLLIFILFLAYFLLLQGVRLIRKQESLKAQAEQQENMLAISRTQYSQLNRYMQQVREARHDLIQHLRVIQQYLEDGREEDLKEYLRHYAQTLPDGDGITYCLNYEVNTIVSFYAEEAKKSQVAFYSNLDLPESLPISEPELCSMLGNLLENALDAAGERSGSVTPFIRIQGSCEKNQILFAIDNSCREEPVPGKGGRFLSSKHEGTGTGIASVRATAEKYSGYASFRYENQVFYASVFLQAPARETFSDKK